MASDIKPVWVYIGGAWHDWNVVQHRIGGQWVLGSDNVMKRFPSGWHPRQADMPGPVADLGLRLTPGADSIRCDWIFRSDVTRWTVALSGGKTESFVLDGTGYTSFTFTGLAADTEFSVLLTAVREGADDLTDTASTRTLSIFAAAIADTFSIIGRVFRPAGSLDPTTFDSFSVIGRVFRPAGEVDPTTSDTYTITGRVFRPAGSLDPTAADTFTIIGRAFEPAMPLAGGAAEVFTITGRTFSPSPRRRLAAPAFVNVEAADHDE